MKDRHTNAEVLDWHVFDSLDPTLYLGVVQGETAEVARETAKRKCVPTQRSPIVQEVNKEDPGQFGKGGGLVRPTRPVGRKAKDISAT